MFSWRKKKAAQRVAAECPGACARGPEPGTPLLQVHLPCPPGWRWVDEQEWRENLELMDVDWETRVGATSDTLRPPLCMVAREPRGFRGASTTVRVEEQTWEGEGAPTTSYEALSLAQTFCCRAYDEPILVTFEESTTLGGYPGDKARLYLSQARKDGPPLLFDCLLHCIAVGDRIVQVCAATAQGASRATRRELEGVLDGIRFRWVRLPRTPQPEGP